jgi:hypothetical protein
MPVTDPPPTNYRWKFSDPDDAGTFYRFPWNPNRMSSPYRPKQFDPAVNRFGPARVLQKGRNAPYEWSFSGRIREQAFHDALLSWSQWTRPFWITDHLGRVWTVMPVRFDITELKPSAHVPDRYDYTFTTFVLGGPA